MDFIFLAIASFLSGITASMGLGGGFVLLLYLNFFTDMGMNESKFINIIFFLVVGSISLFSHNKNGLIEKQLTRKLVYLGIIGAIAGAFIGYIIPTDFLAKIFGGFLLIIGIQLLFSDSPSKKKL